MTVDKSREDNTARSKYIPDDVYDQWVKPNMVVMCTDALIINRSGNLVLGIREIEPVKGLPWIVGGRVPKGMAMEPAVKKRVLAETGLEVAVAGLSGVYRRVYKTGEDRDDLVFTFVALETGGELKADFQHSRFVEIKGYKDPKYELLHDRVKEPIRDSMIFDNVGDHERFSEMLRASCSSGEDFLRREFVRKRNTPSSLHGSNALDALAHLTNGHRVNVSDDVSAL